MTAHCRPENPVPPRRPVCDDAYVTASEIMTIVALKGQTTEAQNEIAEILREWSAGL